MKTALITGITGQDGSYLAELLLEKGYKVHGMVRRSSSHNTQRIDHILPSLHLHYGDLTDSLNVVDLVQKIQPDEIYNLGAQSHVQVSFETPEYTANVGGLGVLRLLEAIRIAGLIEKTKFYQASTSELYGKVAEIPQTEKTPFGPRSPYAAAKLYAYWITVNYRESYGMKTYNGILFNHESERRGETFVTRKITQAVARIHHGLQDKILLGNLDAKRDWGHAKEYVYAMWQMLQTSKPDDFVIATGQTHTVREFVELAFKEIGIDIQWTGSGLDEQGFDNRTGKLLVGICPEFFRPAEVDLLIGSPIKAEKTFGWKSQYSLQELVSCMVQHDLMLMQPRYDAVQTPIQNKNNTVVSPRFL